MRGCEPGAAGKYRIAGWANTWRNETDCSGRRNQAVALPRRGTLERPNSGGRPLSAVGIRTLPPSFVESSLPRRLHCGSRNDPQRMGNGRRRDDPGVPLDQANGERGRWWWASSSAVWMSCSTGERGRAPGRFWANWRPEDSARRRPDVWSGCWRSCPNPKTSTG